MLVKLYYEYNAATVRWIINRGDRLSGIEILQKVISIPPCRQKYTRWLREQAR